MAATKPDAPRSIAVLIPCLNEAAAIGAVVAEFRAALPDASIHVFDNGSTDATAAVASAAGADVRSVALRGKGNVVRRMFADVEADIYVLVDGDGTYDASAAPEMLAELLRERLDMLVGVRAAESGAAYRLGHSFGNRLLTGFLRRLFGGRSADILSGYRVFSRRFVKSFPVLSSGFEIETELTVHALELRLAIGEATTVYRERAEGSQSKLRTLPDGIRILTMIVRLFSAERPLMFYTLVAIVLAVTAVVLAVPIFLTFAATGEVPRFPTAILSMGLMLMATLSFYAGLILDTVTRGRREQKLLHYLMQRAPD
jgi:glycosyltransferase involved in cell wall biosynthesis